MYKKEILLNRIQQYKHDIDFQIMQNYSYKYLNYIYKELKNNKNIRLIKYKNHYYIESIKKEKYIIAHKIDKIKKTHVYWLRWNGHNFFHKINNYKNFINALKKMGYKKTSAGTCGSFGYITSEYTEIYKIRA